MRLVFLDTGTLGMVANPRGTPRAVQCQRWTSKVEVKRDIARIGLGNSLSFSNSPGSWLFIRASSCTATPTVNYARSPRERRFVTEKRSSTYRASAPAKISSACVRS
jgi:hypothetical protein